MSDRFIINGLGGERKLRGSVAVSGAKNAALKLMAAAALFKDEVVLRNVPNIEDTKKMAELLVSAGARVAKTGEHEYAISCGQGFTSAISADISKKMRASIVLAGPLLARFGKVSFPHPGGCVIGKRPIDIFLDGFESMGAVITTAEKSYDMTVPGGALAGREIFLKHQSVTATETFMMAATLARGTTTIKNVALEPEIEDLARFLTMGGARISGIGTTTIVVEGGDLLSARGQAYTVMPDRIEAGSFLILGALAGEGMEITGCNPAHLESLIETLRAVGVPVATEGDRIRVSAPPSGSLRSVDIKTHEYPGFPTDIQAPMVILLTQATGEALVFETIFEGRLNYVESLKKMGAHITAMDPHRILVKGPTPLEGKTLESPDLRAGLAFVIAGIIAKGSSVIHNVYNIDRGYEGIEGRLSALGVDIVRVGGDADTPAGA